MACMQIQEEREGKERKRKKKSFPTKPCRTTIHVPSRKEEDVETNPMIRREHQYTHQSQRHTPPEFGGVADTLASALHEPVAFSVFLNCTKPKMPSRLINNHKHIIVKLLQSP
jgi:hypothetical protein